jgi:hypothetical protein
MPPLRGALLKSRAKVMIMDYFVCIAHTIVYVLLLLVDVGRVCELLELSGGFD